MKRKKIIAVILSAVITANCAIYVNAEEQTVTVDVEETYEANSSGIKENNEYLYEEFEDGTVLLHKYKGNGGDVVIPSEIDGGKVVGIENAFYGCTSLTSVIIPDSVTWIGYGAFYGCSSLVSAEVPNSVTVIDSEAFCGCSSLKSIDIPDNVTWIGESAFKNCTSLTSIKIPDSATGMGNSAFEGCTALTSAEISVNAEWIGSGAFSDCTSLKSLKIPHGVTEICESTFFRCSSLSSVEIPDSVTKIGESAFWSCFSLKSIEIPNSVTEIGYSAFSNCDSLTAVEIPSGVTDIGRYAFSDCDSLETVNISDSVAMIYNVDAFRYCDSLSNINVNEQNTAYSSLNGVLFNKDQTILLIYPAGKKDEIYSIPNTVTEIEHEAFEDCLHLTSINIPDGVTKIGDSAFDDCSSLISINIPYSVEKIGYSAFWKCTSLTKIDVSEMNPSYSSVEGVLFNKEKTDLIKYPAAKKDKTYSIPNTVVNVGFNAFMDCLSITSIKISDSVTEIKLFAFLNCPSLAEINVDEKNTSYSSQDGVLFNKEHTVLIQYPIGKSDKYYSIPDGVSEINRYAFSDCANIISVVIPNSVTKIGDSAFSGCNSLKSAGIPDGVSEISDNMFFGCESLTLVEISDGVKVIGRRAFAICSSLKSVIIPDSVLSIMTDVYDSFGYCHNDLTFYGIPGSYAEEYANNNKINFNGIKSDSLKDNDSGIEVCTGVSAPSGTMLKVEKISENTEGVTFNITLTDNGVNIDLRGKKVIVRIPVSVSGKSYDYKVYRKESDGKYTNMETIVSNGFLVFFTDHFSEYIVTTENLIPDINLGDVNGDTKINDQDSILLSRYLSEWGNTIDTAAADINGDGKVNDQDSIMLARTLAGWYD